MMKSYYYPPSYCKAILFCFNFLSLWYLEASAVEFPQGNHECFISSSSLFFSPLKVSAAFFNSPVWAALQHHCFTAGARCALRSSWCWFSAWQSRDLGWKPQSSWGGNSFSVKNTFTTAKHKYVGVRLQYQKHNKLTKSLYVYLRCSNIRSTFRLFD